MWTFWKFPCLWPWFWQRFWTKNCSLFASKAFHHSPRTLQPVSSSGAPCDMSWPCGPPLAKIMGVQCDVARWFAAPLLQLLDVTWCILAHCTLDWKAQWLAGHVGWREGGVVGEFSEWMLVSILRGSYSNLGEKVQCWHTVPWSPCLSLGSIDATTILTAFGLNTWSAFESENRKYQPKVTSIIQISSFWTWNLRKDVLLREAHWPSRPLWYQYDARPTFLSNPGPCLQDQRMASTAVVRSCGDFQCPKLGGLGFPDRLELHEPKDLIKGMDPSTKVTWVLQTRKQQKEDKDVEMDFCRFLSAQ